MGSSMRFSSASDTADCKKPKRRKMNLKIITLTNLNRNACRKNPMLHIFIIRNCLQEMLAIELNNLAMLVGHYYFPKV